MELEKTLKERKFQIFSPSHFPSDVPLKIIPNFSWSYRAIEHFSGLFFWPHLLQILKSGEQSLLSEIGGLRENHFAIIIHQRIRHLEENASRKSQCRRKNMARKMEWKQNEDSKLRVKFLNDENVFFGCFIKSNEEKKTPMRRREEKYNVTYHTKNLASLW